MGIAALVLGIIGLLISFIPFVGIVGVVLTGLAVILGGIGLRKREGRGLAIAGLVLGVIGTAVALAWFFLVRSAVDSVGKRSKVEITRVRIQQIAREYFPRWSLANTDKACPDNVLELVRVADPAMQPGDVTDPWGHPIKMICGDALPAGARGIAIYSFGENGKDETGGGDDIKSW